MIRDYMKGNEYSYSQLIEKLYFFILPTSRMRSRYLKKIN